MDNNHPNQEQENPNYQPAKPFALTDEVRKDISEAVRSINMEEIRFVKTLTIPERVQIAVMMIEVDEQNAVNHLRQVVPELEEVDALRMIRGGQKNYLWQRRRHDP